MGSESTGGREQRTKKVATTSYVLGDGAEAIMHAPSARGKAAASVWTKRAKNMLEAVCRFSAR
jgi:hypothetical protein